MTEVRHAGLQYGLPGTWSGMRKRGMTPEDLTRLWSTHAAKLAGMQERKGALALGMDADVVVRDSPAHTTHTIALLLSKGPSCQSCGCTLDQHRIACKQQSALDASVLRLVSSSLCDLPC